MLVLLRIAIRNLAQAPRRSGLLGLAIGLVTALLVLLLSLSQGIEDSLVGAATQLSGGHVTVAGFHKATPGDASPVVTEATKLRALVEANTPGLDYAVARQRGWGKVISERGSTQAGLTGIYADQEERLFEVLQLADESEYVEGGRDEIIGDLRELAEPKTAMIFAAQARDLQVKVGDLITFQIETDGGYTNTMDCTVVAVARDLGMLSGFSTFVNGADLVELYRMSPDTTGAIWLYLKDIDQSTAVMGHLREVLADKGYTLMDHQPAPFFFKFDTVAGEDWTGQKLDLTIWRDEVSFLTWVLTAFDTVTWALSLVLLAIIAVGIMNALWSAVRERTKELGTMRAIGLTRSRVLVLFLLEAVMLGAFATVTGAVVGTAIAMGIDAANIAVPNDAMRSVLLSETLNLSVRPVAMVTAVIALTTFTGLSAVLPAMRAARLPPVTALGHIE